MAFMMAVNLWECRLWCKMPVLSNFFSLFMSACKFWINLRSEIFSPRKKALSAQYIIVCQLSLERIEFWRFVSWGRDETESQIFKKELAMSVLVLPGFLISCPALNKKRWPFVHVRLNASVTVRSSDKNLVARKGRALQSQLRACPEPLCTGLWTGFTVSRQRSGRASKTLMRCQWYWLNPAPLLNDPHKRGFQFCSPAAVPRSFIKNSPCLSVPSFASCSWGHWSPAEAPYCALAWCHTLTFPFWPLVLDLLTESPCDPPSPGTMDLNLLWPSKSLTAKHLPTLLQQESIYADFLWHALALIFTGPQFLLLDLKTTPCQGAKWSDCTDSPSKCQKPCAARSKLQITCRSYQCWWFPYQTWSCCTSRAP